jgi:hypothetical protein
MTPDDKLAADLAAELAVHPPVEIVLTATGALHLAAMLQLTLRHPLISQSTREAAELILEQLRHYFADAPATMAVLLCGDDPNQDRPWRPES